MNPWKGLSCSPLRNPSITYRALKSSPSNAASTLGSNRSDKVWVAVGMEVLSPAFQADAVTALCLRDKTGGRLSPAAACPQGFGSRNIRPALLSRCGCGWEQPRSDPATHVTDVSHLTIVTRLVPYSRGTS